MKKIKKEIIQEVVVYLFCDKGYLAIFMCDLVEVVNLKALSLYNYIFFKEEILCNICFDNVYCFIFGMEEVEKFGVDVFVQVCVLLFFYIWIVMEDVIFVIVFNDEWCYFNEFYFFEFKVFCKDYEQWFCNIFSIGMKSGVFW